MILLAIALVSCASEQVIAPNLAQEQVKRAWRREQHAVWELDWPVAPVAGPLTAEVWRAGKRLRIEILESAAPALVGQTLIFDGQTGWRYNRFETNAPKTASTPILSPVSDAFETIDRLANIPPIAATRQEGVTLDHGPTEKITLTFENGDTLTVWVERESELPIRLTFRVGGNQVDLKARLVESLADPPEALFRPDITFHR